jgi:hypothetical protein
MSQVKLAVEANADALPVYRDAKADALEDFHRRYFRELMASHPSLTSAAEAAGMDRKHLRLLLRRVGLWEG